MSLFANDDINKIIHRLRMRYGTKLFGDCGGVFAPKSNEVKLLNPAFIPKDSASFTDVILSNAEIGVNQFRVAIKLWFNWDDFGLGVLEKKIDEYCGSCTIDEKLNILTAMRMEPNSAAMAKNREDAIEFFYSLLKESVDDGGSDSLIYEARVYSYITENIIMRNISPCFIPLFSTNDCPVENIISTLDSVSMSPMETTLYAKLKFIQAISDNKARMQFVITGSGKNMKSLHNFFTDGGLVISDSEIERLIFQLFYNIYVMQSYEIFHGDLHFGNIFVQTLDAEESMSFTVNEYSVKFSTKYIIKMYDYDAAVVTGLGENPKSYDQLYIGRTTKFRESADFMQVLCGLASHGSQYPVIQRFLQKIDLHDIANILKRTSVKARGQCSELVSCPEFNEYLKTKEVSEEQGKRKYYRISVLSLMSALEKMPAPFRDGFIKMIEETVTKDELGYIKTLLISHASVSNKITVCNRWHCSVAHDYDVSIIPFFESDLFYDIAPKEFLISFTSPKLRYTFIPRRDDDVFIPPENLHEIYEAVRRHRLKRKSVEEEPASFSSELARLLNIPAAVGQTRSSKAFRDLY